MCVEKAACPTLVPRLVGCSASWPAKPPIILELSLSTWPRCQGAAGLAVRREGLRGACGVKRSPQRQRTVRGYVFARSLPRQKQRQTQACGTAALRDGAPTTALRPPRTPSLTRAVRALETAHKTHAPKNSNSTPRASREREVNRTITHRQPSKAEQAQAPRTTAT